MCLLLEPYLTTCHLNIGVLYIKVIKLDTPIFRDWKMLFSFDKMCRTMLVWVGGELVTLG